MQCILYSEDLCCTISSLSYSIFYPPLSTLPLSLLSLSLSLLSLFFPSPEDAEKFLESVKPTKPARKAVQPLSNKGLLSKIKIKRIWQHCIIINTLITVEISELTQASGEGCGSEATITGQSGVAVRRSLRTRKPRIFMSSEDSDDSKEEPIERPKAPNVKSVIRRGGERERERKRERVRERGGGGRKKTYNEVEVLIHQLTVPLTSDC